MVLLNAESRDELAALLEEHRVLSLAMLKLTDPSWSASLLLSNDSEVADEDEPYVFEVDTAVCREIVTARYNTIVLLLREKGVTFEKEVTH